ncbi:uncharacterized protein LOC119097909 isoform X2 [Pollicipes pollicipes]|uniref:uncharacterized protein LOC119097909 isoform X2 n=1 Tax=Pollicipes pollicipes TaxID=41117 RepID=UPI0018855A27|nr:uncharacterized protein LOC119097909 isoform X2 [Pollicipes pollicipes]
MSIPQQVSDPANVLRFGLYSVHLDTKDTAPPELVGEAEVHLHEIIKAMMVIDVVSLRLDGRVVASLDLEFAFMYGSMGFCYSTQLENAAFDASRDLGRSMFPRLTLPEERDGEVLVPMPQHAPAFVPWTCSTVTHWDEQLQRLPPVWPPAAPTQFTESVHAEVRRILTDYVPITSRPDRLAFLRRLIRGTPVREPDEGESGAGDDRPADQHHGSDPGPAQLSTTPTDAGRPQLSERPPAASEHGARRGTAARRRSTGGGGAGNAASRVLFTARSAWFRDDGPATR